MDTTRAVEESLFDSELVGQATQNRRVQTHALVRDLLAPPDLHRLQRCLPTHPTTRAHVEISGNFLRIEGDTGPQLHDDDVVRLGLVGLAVADLRDVLGSAHEPLSIQESRRQLEVMAWRSHRDRDGGRLPLSVQSVLHTDFERFLHRHEVHTVAEAAVVQSRNPDP